MLTCHLPVKPPSFSRSTIMQQTQTHLHFHFTNTHTHTFTLFSVFITTMITIPPSPSPAPESTLLPQVSSPSKPPVRFTPPLIVMVVIIATAFITIAYSRAISRRFLLLRRRWRQWRRRRRLLNSYVPSSVGNGDIEDNISGEDLYNPTYGYQLFSPYGLDDAVIKTIPLSIHTRKSSVHECAVCLLEFEDNDYVRTLPVCYHAFHVDCIDIWLRCHANCPLCRASVFRPESPFSPMMSARIRPNFDDVIIESTIIEPEPVPVLSPEPEPEILLHGESATTTSTTAATATAIGEITQEVTLSPMRNLSEDRFNRRDFLLKRSYSFGFERNLGSERLVMEPATASPWRYGYRRGGGGSFWSKRPSPFSSLTKNRVFSFRLKSPFFRRRSGSFLPLSEPTDGGGSGGGGGSSSRRRKSFASPIFMRQSGVNVNLFSSSRLRSGDPEALLSSERYNRR
ncbi:putative transcription factor C2H2 family [Helianthus annuus]|nr:putative transcription factor C2H2 family [Helianthus annuus]